ncbi:hypothetical protein ACJX0J_024839, partial [Zea mays]
TVIGRLSMICQNSNNMTCIRPAVTALKMGFWFFGVFSCLCVCGGGGGGDGLGKLQRRAIKTLAVGLYKNNPESLVVGLVCGDSLP